MNQEIAFIDTDEFYTHLKQYFDAGDAVEVTTPFTGSDQLPTRLKDIFQLHELPPLAPGFHTMTSLNPGPIVVIVATATGAAIGGSVAGKIGAVIGAGIGLAAGTVAAGMMSNKFEVEVIVDANGRLHIKVRPKRDFTS